MKLSEALRLGSIATLPCKGKFYDSTTESACALGAIMVAQGLIAKYQPFSCGEIDQKYITVMRDLGHLYPILRKTIKIEGILTQYVSEWYEGASAVLFGIIVTLNDRGISRNQIADWLETSGYDQEQVTELKDLAPMLEVVV